MTGKTRARTAENKNGGKSSGGKAVLKKDKRCFILTVGTSLTGNFKKTGSCHIKFPGSPAKNLEFENGQPDSDAIRFANDKIAKSGIEKWLDRLKKTSTLPSASAELQSLLHMFPAPGEGDKAVLIATRTPEGMVCAQLLKKTLEELALVVECFHPNGLSTPQDPEFVDTGLPALLSVLTREITKHEKSYRVVLIPTGGYKSIIPYAVLAGIIHGKDIRYIYEFSDRLVSLPALPIGLDTARWKPAYLKLKVLTTRARKETTAYYRDLDPAFRNLLIPPEKDSKPYRLTHLGDYLVERYLNLQYRTPLQHHAAGTSLLKYLERTNGSKADLVKFFGQLTEVGPHFWFGDKVPEMVEHSAHHHTNLFEIAEVLLLPILNEDNNFLSPEELFILLGTIYFHDWGHSIARLGKTALLPTEIRKWHHVLSYQRMKSLSWRRELIDAGIKWTDANPVRLWKEYLAAIATVGVYHRQKMPLSKGESKPCRPYLAKKFGPLARNTRITFEGTTIRGSRAAFIAALFRVIDSLDNQVARMGSPEEVAMKAAVVAGDAREANRRKREIGTILRDYLGSKNNKLFKEIAGHAKIISGDYRRVEGADRKRPGPGAAPAPGTLRGTCKELAGKLKDVDEAQKAVFARLVESYLEAAAWGSFRESQPAHYLKHLAVRAPVISYQGKNGERHRVEISFEAQSPGEMKILARALGIKTGNIPDFADIVKGIQAEYNDEVRQVLEKNNLQIEYK